jgi:TonB family protein
MARSESQHDSQACQRFRACAAISSKPLVNGAAHSILRASMAGVKSRLALCLVLLIGAPSNLVAQDVHAPLTPPVGAEPKAAPVVVAPKLKDFAEPTFPPEALAQGLSGRVEVELVVGVDGHVSDVKIKTPAGYGFDEAALEAAQRLTFEPATRDGIPLAARIVFPYVFEFRQPEPPPPEEEPAPQPARLEGRVLQASGARPLVGAELIVASADHSVTRRAVTDGKGAFALDALPAGTYHVSVSMSEWLTQEMDEALAPGEITTVVYRLQSAPDAEAFHAVARVAPPPREVTRRTIGKEELTRIPGTRGDALRTVELLPGVARPPFGAGQIIVRGSAPADTQLLLDGIPISLLYHFGGLTSFINSRLLESVDFYPGNFSVRYGRRRGGIIEATLADPARDRLHGVADLNLIDGSVLAQGPIAANSEFAVAARRSWVDLVLGSLLSSSDVTTVAAPVYYDYQALATYRPSDHDKLRLILYGSSDNLKLLFQQPSDQDPTITGNLKVATRFYRAHASWSRKISDRVDHDLEIAAGVFDLEFGLGNAFDVSFKGFESYLRSEWRARVSDSVRLIAGLDTVFIPATLHYAGPQAGQQEGNPDNGSGATAVSNRSRSVADEKLSVVQPAVYLESDLDLAPFHVVLGSRVDYFSEIRKFAFDPRLAVHYSLTENTRLKAGLGMFTQPAQPQESSLALGNPNLRPTHTVHAGVGFDHTVMPGVRFGVEGFYKYLYDRIIGTDEGQAPRFVNGGKGRILGLEVSAKVDPHGRFFGYLSYTLSRSERMDHNEGYRLFDFDQPHILTLTGVYRLGRGWEAGVTFRMTSGSLTTPVVAAVYNKDTGLYSPVYGPVNSLRARYFHRADLRIEKLWTFTSWKLALYLDVQNVYNRTNSEGVAYDFEYHQTMNISGLPILPNLGLRGEM